MLRICLERRRFKGLSTLASEAASRATPDEAAAALAAAAPTLAKWADCTTFSPFVYSWIEAAATSIQSWLSAAVRRQEAWLPLSSELLWSPTVAHLFSASFALLRTLRRLRVVFHGELVAAAQLLSDAHLALATALLPEAAPPPKAESPPPSKRGSPPLRSTSPAPPPPIEALRRAMTLVTLGEEEGEATGNAAGGGDDDEDESGDVGEGDDDGDGEGPPWERRGIYDDGDGDGGDDDDADVAVDGGALRRQVRAREHGVAGAAVAAPSGVIDGGARGRTRRAARNRLAAFAPAFAALKRRQRATSTSSSAGCSLRPHIALVEAPLAAPHTAAGGGGGGAHAHAARVGASLGVILQEMSEELRRAAGWLLTVLLSLAQKAWTSVLSELNSLLLRHLYVPRAIGGALGADLLEALNAIQPLLRCGGGGPTADWLQRRAAPLVATLQLLDTPTGALVAAHAQQKDGSPARAAALAALALRMDDPFCAAVVGAEGARDDAWPKEGVLLDGRAALATARGADVATAAARPLADAPAPALAAPAPASATRLKGAGGKLRLAARLGKPKRRCTNAARA